MRSPQAYPLLSHLADHGWICVSIDYRVSPRNTWPDHIVDVKRALAWIKEHIAEYGGDPDFVAISGGSAGGHLAALAALTPNDPQFQPGFEDADTSVVAAVPIYGRYDWVSGRATAARNSSASCRSSWSRRPISQNRQPYVDASPVAGYAPTRHRFSSFTGRTTRSSQYPRPASSSAALKRGVDVAGGVRRDAARPARFRLLRFTARSLHRAGRRDVPVLDISQTQG